MININIQDKTIFIKKTIDEEVSKFLKNRELCELTKDELIEFNSMLIQFNNLLKDKIEMQEEKLDKIKKSIRRNIDALAESNK